MINLHFNYIKVFNTIDTSLCILIGFFYVILISPFNNNLTKKIVKIYIYSLSCTLRFFEFLFKIKYVKVCPRINVTQKFVEDCADKLNKIKMYKKNKKYIGVTKEFLTNPNFLVLSYLQIKNNSDNIFISKNKKALDGINKNWFINAAKKINLNTYKFTSATIVEILKPNSEGLKPLTIGSSKDKIIQKAVSIIINQIYEYKDKTFFDMSHGFRPTRSTHTALKEIKTKWTNLYWFIEAEIEKTFEKIQHTVLINLLNKKIKDQRLTDLIFKMFNSRVLAPNNFYFKNNMGVPQGNVLSPLLSNIYLHEFDFFMDNLIKKYYKGKSPSVNQKYYKKLELNKYESTLANEIQNLIKRNKRKHLFNKGIKPYLIDHNYLRMKYVRYAEDFLVGIQAPKPIVKKIKVEISNWLEMTLHFKLNDKKTDLLYIIGNKIKFLGFNLYSIPNNQMPFRNSRRIEKFKRVKKKILAYTKVTEKKLSKRIKIDLIAIIKKKLKIKNKKSSKKVIHELSDVLVNILNDEEKTGSKYREIIRELQSKLTNLILNDTQENIKIFLKRLIHSKLLDLSEITQNFKTYFTQRNTTLISKIKIPASELIQKFSKLLKINKYEHYRNWDLKKTKFEKNLIIYLLNNNITLTYYPINIILPTAIKNKIIKTSKIIHNKVLSLINYIIIINYFWKKQNKIDFILKITKKRSENIKARLKAIEYHSGIRVILPIKIKVDWDEVVERLKIKGFLNKKARPACVIRLITLKVANMIKYFRSVLYGYLCVLYTCLQINGWIRLA